jgi:hypothetical protein
MSKVSILRLAFPWRGAMSAALVTRTESTPPDWRFGISVSAFSSRLNITSSTTGWSLTKYSALRLNLANWFGCHSVILKGPVPSGGFFMKSGSAMSSMRIACQ